MNSIQNYGVVNHQIGFQSKGCKKTLKQATYTIKDYYADCRGILPAKSSLRAYEQQAKNRVGAGNFYNFTNNLIKNKEVLTKNEIFRIDFVSGVPTMITKTPLKNQNGAIPAGTRLTLNGETLSKYAIINHPLSHSINTKNIDYSNLEIPLSEIGQNGELLNQHVISLNIAARPSPGATATMPKGFFSICIWSRFAFISRFC